MRGALLESRFYDQREMDARTDGQGETSIPPFNLVEASGIIIYCILVEI